MMKTAHVICHTHWDREWYLTQRQFQYLLGTTFDNILDVLESDPEFAAFVADGQTVILSDYAEIRPGNKERFLNLAQQGRLQMGPWYTMPDVWLPDGESIIRNLLMGCMDCESLGLPHPKMGYVPDSFGHIEQMPQIMNGFGISNYLFSRGDTMKGLGETMQFVWKAPDGVSSVIAHKLDGYMNLVGVPDPSDPGRLIKQVGGILERFGKHSSDPDTALLMNGIDHIWIQPDIPVITKALRDLFPDWNFRMGTLTDYLSDITLPETGRIPEYIGNLRGSRLTEGLLHGTWSSRMDVKLANATAENTLLNLAEPLIALASIHGGPERRSELGLAWKQVLVNHAHDSICGCSMDAVHTDNLGRFRQSVEIAEMAVAEALDFMNAQAVLDGTHTLIHYAGLGGSRGPVDFLIDMPAGTGSNPFHLEDSDGNRFPIQVNGVRELIRTDVAFDAGEWKSGESTSFGIDEVRGVAMLPEMPPLSVTKYRVVDGPGSGLPKETDPVLTSGKMDTLAMENSQIRVTAFPDGTVSILQKSTGSRYEGLLSLSREADMGGGYTFRPKEGDRPSYSTGVPFSLSRLEVGPLRCAIRMEGTWEVANGHILVVTEVSLSSDSPVLECRMILDNHAFDQRIRLKLPLPYPSGHADVERAFVVAGEDMDSYTWEPGQDTHPMRNWVHIPSPQGTTGLALVGKGLHEWSLSPDGESRSMLDITLLRCVPFVYDCGTWKTPEAEMQGVTEYEFALIPTEGDWREGNVALQAHRYRHKGIMEPHGGPKPPWNHLMHASVALNERKPGGTGSPVGTHRSGWRKTFGHRDGWRRFEERRVPTNNFPSKMRPISLSDSNVLISSIRTAGRSPEGGADYSSDLVIRLYNQNDKAVTTKVTFGFGIAGVCLAGLDESPISEPLVMDGPGYPLSLLPFQIVTLRLKLLQ